MDVANVTTRAALITSTRVIFFHSPLRKCLRIFISAYSRIQEFKNCKCYINAFSTFRFYANSRIGRLNLPAQENTQIYGEGKWHLVAERAGLNRCRKSCRLRWINYLDPNVNHGKFEKDEIKLVIRMHRLLGNRWSMIAGRLPGRTANDIKNYFNTYLRKTLESQPKEEEEEEPNSTRRHQVIRPLPRYPTTVIATGGPLLISGNPHHHKQAPPTEQNDARIYIMMSVPYGGMPPSSSLN